MDDFWKKIQNIKPDSNDLQAWIDHLKSKTIVDWGSLTSAEKQHLLDTYPYLFISQGLGDVDFKEVEQTQGQCGWNLLNYGKVVCGGRGDSMFGPDFKDQDTPNQGQGTIIDQAFKTAFEMVAIGKGMGWESLYIAEGHQVMQRAAWIAGTEVHEMQVQGFEPTEADINIRALWRKSPEEILTLLSKVSSERSRRLSQDRESKKSLRF